MRHRGPRFELWGAVAVGAVVSSVGCSKTWRGDATQPNPLIETTETLRVSTPIVIVTGDMELSAPDGRSDLRMSERRYPLRNVASIAFVSRDRLRVHVRLEHKWRDYADAASWHGTLIVDRQRRHEPEQVDQGRVEPVTYMWDYEQRSVIRNRYGDVAGVRNDGHRRRVPLGNMTLFRGRADFVFYSRDIFTPDTESVEFILERSGYRFVFEWRFAES